MVAVEILGVSSMMDRDRDSHNCVSSRALYLLLVLVFITATEGKLGQGLSSVRSCCEKQAVQRPKASTPNVARTSPSHTTRGRQSVAAILSQRLQGVKERKFLSEAAAFGFFVCTQAVNQTRMECKGRFGQGDGLGFCSVRTALMGFQSEELSNRQFCSQKTKHQLCYKSQKESHPTIRTPRKLLEDTMPGCNCHPSILACVAGTKTLDFFLNVFTHHSWTANI